MRDHLPTSAKTLLQRVFLLLFSPKILVLGLFLLAASPLAAQPATRRILILTSYDPNHPAVTTITQSLSATIRNGSAERVEFFFEYQENFRIPNQKYESEMVAYLKKKYEGVNINLIVCLGAPALNFVLRHDFELFQNTPKVFYFHDESEETVKTLWPRVTGVWAQLELDKTLSLALKNHPKAKRVFVVSGNSAQDKFLRAEAENEFKSFESRVEINYLSNLTISELRNQVSHLPSDSVVIYLSFFVDRNGNSYSGPEALAMFATSSSAPIYGISDTYLGSGIVGGSLLDFESLGKRTGELALRILNGEKPENIRPQTFPTVLIFDWRELSRWGINESSLPEGSVIKFKEYTFWEKYKWYAIYFAVAGVIEALLIVWLLIINYQRRRAELESQRFATLAKSAHRDLTEVVSNVPGIVWESRNEVGAELETLTFISDYVEQMLGYTAKECLAAPGGFLLSIMASDADRERVKLDAEFVASTGKNRITNFCCVTRAGQTIWIEASLTPLRDSDGKTVGLRGVSLDVTEKTRASAALRQTEERSQAILTAIPDLIFVQTKEGVYLDYHAKDPGDLQLLPEQFLGRNMAEVLPNELVERFQKCFERTDHDREPQVLDYSMMIEGAERWFEARIVRSGENVLSVVRDITERKIAEDELRQSEERFEKAFRANPQPMSLTTMAKGVYLDVNDSFLNMSGYSRDEVIGKSSLELNIWETPQSRVTFLESLKEAGSLMNLETKFRTKNGSFRVLLSSAEELEIDNESCLLVASSDITERRESEEQLKKAHAELAELKNQLEAENIYLQAELQMDHTFGEIVGQSDAIKYVTFKINQIATTDSTVLITGETGTGKELVARAIHEASKRSHRPLIKVNCAALSPTLIESELFGHEKGAFTGAAARKIGRFELADGGTIFLDEIGELPLELQVKLLRVIQEGEFERVGSTKTLKVDVRIIAATNRNLTAEVDQGTFRQDLWYRLNVFPITVPPLKQRPADVPLLVEHFVKRAARKFGKKIDTVSARTMQTLQSHSWPGNVRELANVVERAVIHTQGNVLHLAEHFARTPIDQPSGIKSLEEVEREYILRILENTGWRIEGPAGAARILNLNPSTLRTRMAKLNIQKGRTTNA